MNKVISFITCAVFCIVPPLGDMAKILAVFPVPSISHQVVFRPLTQELAKRGHEVTVITPDPAFPKGATPANLTEIDLHDISYGTWRQALRSVTKSTDIISQISSMTSALIAIQEAQMKTPEVQKLLNETNDFQLLLLEACSEPALIFSHIYKVPVITVSSFGSAFYNNKAMGVPTHPLLYPTMTSQRIHSLTTWEKLQELYKYYSLSSHYEGTLTGMANAMLKNMFGPDTPTIQELNENVAIMLLNVHPLWTGNVPVPPSVINIWGIHKRVEKELPQDIKSYLDSSKHGVIYMSFGTNAPSSNLPAEKIQAFVKVFSGLPYDVLWKWDQDELPGRTENIRIGKWFPQSDLLRHPKIKLFITQGGLQSTEEAINAGVPLVGVPVLGDQWYNVEKYVQLKIGKSLDLHTLTEADVRYAVDSVIKDSSYRENMVKLRSLMRDEPQPALERAVWWTEHVLRHGGAKHLRSPAANLNWIQYYEIPLIATLLTFTGAVIIAVVAILRLVVKPILVAILPQIKIKRH